MTCTEDGVSVIMYPIFRKSLMSEAFVGPASSRKDFVRPALTRSFSFVPFAGLGHAHNHRWFQHCWTRLGYLGYLGWNLRMARFWTTCLRPVLK